MWGPQGPPSLLASALGCSCWGPRTYLGAAATGPSAEVKEVPALLQVQRPQVVLKHARREVLWGWGDRSALSSLHQGPQGAPYKLLFHG